jgi:enoyl-CoA hydratase
MAESGIRAGRTANVAEIVLDRPAVKNALDEAALAALATALREAASDADVHLVTIAAAGEDFCVGQDVKQLAATGPRGDYFEPVFLALKALHKPVVCAARGFCLAGGAGIVLGADVRIIGRSTRFGWPHTRIGISSIGGPSGLARAIPPNLALELMFTGDFLDAERAAALGLANHVVDDDRLEETMAGIVAKILKNAPLALQAAKRATIEGLDLPYRDAVANARAILDRLMQTEDAREGMRAFAEKRPPRWLAR